MLHVLCSAYKSRFKVTGTGKVVYARPGVVHKRFNKTKSQLFRLANLRVMQKTCAAWGGGGRQWGAQRWGWAGSLGAVGCLPHGPFAAGPPARPPTWPACLRPFQPPRRYAKTVKKLGFKTRTLS